MLDDDELRRELEVHPDQTTRELAQRFHCSNSTIDEHLHGLGYRKVLSQWTPHALTDANRAARVSVCQSLLLRPHRAELLADLGDGRRELDPLRKRHAPRLLAPSEKRTLQLSPDATTVIARFSSAASGTSAGCSTTSLLTGNETVNVNVYCRQLRALADAVREKAAKTGSSRSPPRQREASRRCRDPPATGEPRLGNPCPIQPVPQTSPHPTFHLFRALKIP